MNAPLENRNRVAGVEGFGRRSPHEGVTTQSKDDILARLERLLAQREGSCESVVEPQGPLPLRARETGEGPRDRASRDKLEAFLRTDCAAIEAEVGVKNARPHTPKAASWKAATSNALPDSTDELTASRHKAQTSIEAEVGVKNARPHTPKAASWKAATSNALPDSTDELTASRHKAQTLASDPVCVVDRRDALPRIFLMAAVVIIGLAGLGAGIAFWNKNSDLARASEAETELAEPSSQVATRVDVPAQFAARADSGSLAHSGEQTGDAPQPPAKTPSAIAPRGDGGPANQTASAPLLPTPTFQAEPVGIRASFEPNKGETSSTALLNGATPSFEAPPEAAAKLLSSQNFAVVAPPSTPRTAARTPKTAKPSAAAKLDNRRHPEPVVKPASAPEHAPPSENNELFPNLKSAQETVDSLREAVQNLAPPL